MTTSSVEDAVLPITNNLWIMRELGDARFGDARLTQRAMTIAQDLSAHPDQSLASIYEGNLGGLHAAYRFYDNPAVTPAKILAPTSKRHGRPEVFEVGRQADAVWARLRRCEWGHSGRSLVYGRS